MRYVLLNRVTAVNGKYMIGVYTLRKIEFGEELTFDYCCVTEVCSQHQTLLGCVLFQVIFVTYDDVNYALCKRFFNLAIWGLSYCSEQGRARFVRLSLRKPRL